MRFHSARPGRAGRARVPGDARRISPLLPDGLESADALLEPENRPLAPVPRKLPREILDRVDRVAEFHRSTRLTPASVRAHPTVLDQAIKPSPYRLFDGLPQIPLLTTLLDAPASAVDVLNEGLEAVPESQVQPPQDLKTLSSWLFMANGLSAKFDTAAPQAGRTCPSSGALYPFEIYVAAFGIEGLEPGLYHYNIRDFSLCKLRDGAVTLATIKRGRPDLNFLKGVPGALLVSTNFWRSAWRYRQRGYRMALLDAGHLVQNLVAAANGLGVATMPRLQMNDKTMRELIGIDAGVDFGGDAECVQAMVVWATPAKNPLLESPGVGQRTELPFIPRAPLSRSFVPYGSIVATHEDCTAPGVALREIRPPLTELSPIPVQSLSAAPKYTQQPAGGPSMRTILMTRRSMRSFAERSITRDQFLAINRLVFRGGSVFPMMPDGPHVALVRPYWVAHIIAGMDSGIYYYDPATDGLACLTRGNFHKQSGWLCVEQKICSQASAVCFLMADLRTLTASAGPDAYRLAHIEAGLVGQRIYLAAHGLGLGCVGIGAFYDDEIKNFLSLGETGWDPIYALAIGNPVQR